LQPLELPVDPLKNPRVHRCRHCNNKPVATAITRNNKLSTAATLKNPRVHRCRHSQQQASTAAATRNNKPVATAITRNNKLSTAATTRNNRMFAAGNKSNNKRCPLLPPLATTGCLPLATKATTSSGRRESQ
jgi:hypothetical protein